VAEERVVAAQVDHVALEPVELRPAVVQQEEREVLRRERPLVGRPLQVDYVIVLADVDRERGDRQPASA
jgi:hypothetical protein